MKGTWVKLGIAATGTALVSLVGSIDNAEAATIFSTGAGSAVTTVDRSANFDLLQEGQQLNNYQENGLTVSSTVNASRLVGFNPFGGASFTNYYFGTGSNGASPPITIKTADGAKMTGLEFLFGSSSGAPFNILWETRLGGQFVSDGFNSVPAIGTTLGWNDSGGFDELIISGLLSPGNERLSLALDNLNVQLLAASPPTPTPIPTPALLPGLIGMGLAAMRKKKGTAEVGAE